MNGTFEPIIRFIEGLDSKSRQELEKFVTGTMQSTLGISPVAVRRLLKQADNYIQVGRLEDALQIYSAAVTFEPLNAVHLTGFANCALMLGRPKLALRACSALIALQPENPTGHLLSGVACRMLGRHAEAAEDFAEARRLAAETDKAHLVELAQRFGAN